MTSTVQHQRFTAARKSLLQDLPLSDIPDDLQNSLVMTFCANAQNAPGSPSVNAQNPRYRLVDLGTFGGPASHFPNGYDGILNNHGTAVGWSEAVAINDRGEIAGFGVPPGCAPQNYGDCGHA